MMDFANSFNLQKHYNDIFNTEFQNSYFVFQNHLKLDYRTNLFVAEVCRTVTELSLHWILICTDANIIRSVKTTVRVVICKDR